MLNITIIYVKKLFIFLVGFNKSPNFARQMDNFCLNEPNFFKQQTLTPKSRGAVLNPKFFLHNYLLETDDGCLIHYNPNCIFSFPITMAQTRHYCVTFFSARTCWTSSTILPLYYLTILLNINREKIFLLIY